MQGKLQAIILAAGKSSRFKTKRPKQLSPLCGKPMILWPIDVLNSLSLPLTVVLGYQAEEVKKTILDAGYNYLQFCLQTELNGTAGALLASQHTWHAEHILVINGDSPLLDADDIEPFIQQHLETDAVVSLMTTTTNNPTGYGRIVTEGHHLRIIEEKECSPQEKLITTINPGIYLFKRAFLEQTLFFIDKSVVTGELYLTDLIYCASQQGYLIQTTSVPYNNVRCVNTLEELATVEHIMRMNHVKKWMAHGVRFEMPESVIIDHDVDIGMESFIGAHVHLKNGTLVGNHCVIDAFSYLSNALLADNVHVGSHTVIYDSALGMGAHVGPFARLRDGVILHKDVTVGNFVEIKKSTIGTTSKMKHLAYIGDATLGADVNIGAGSIICNHDGVQKHPTSIKDGAYIGSNTTLIAPLTVEKGAIVAAGSVITHNIEPGDLAIARARQVNKPGYAHTLRQRLKAGGKVSYPPTHTSPPETTHYYSQKAEND